MIIQTSLNGVNDKIMMMLGTDESPNDFYQNH